MHFHTHTALILFLSIFGHKKAVLNPQPCSKEMSSESHASKSCASSFTFVPHVVFEAVFASSELYFVFLRLHFFSFRLLE